MPSNYSTVADEESAPLLNSNSRGGAGGSGHAGVAAPTIASYEEPGRNADSDCVIYFVRLWHTSSFELILPAGDGGPNPVVVVPIDDFAPPTYTSVSGGAPMVICRVCQNSIDISGKREQHVVKCGSCHEATPIRNAPHGRQYVRCPCNCLLICKNNSKVSVVSKERRLTPWLSKFLSLLPVFPDFDVFQFGRFRCGIFISLFCWWSFHSSSI